ncbi:protein-L-isoaspartate(D-aspartate) O-methyltransferase [Rhodovulum imhoffii]|uniref:Protein-L-isoaspartate O-methyltransferase n=1 Tax=Rhodovulum imhoffii TaxID=365340 RepID=A0A2T5BR27_9RHOB|nr:protein-L-isoaspartate O-methyltransferase [Rhodovulum imhoffii]MBK5934975.1 protein-L-isoaspartate O-methyltransferase [Rhodovulum imhoffii]PTN01674.1 protein-L-isoaspartate(D-aspartate) O-methyltransferase [Rhodovulum imhoffii]
MTDFTARRIAMVDTQVRPSDVTRLPIIDAMLSVPREVYVPDARREAAYVGENLDLGGGRVLLEPRTFAKMLEELAIQPDELVLDLGCAQGYSSAVLARLAQTVVGVEEDSDLAREAETNLAEQGAYNAAVVCGPLTEGAPRHGPYDAMIVQGAISRFPQVLADQLRPGGRVVALTAEKNVGMCRVGLKGRDGISWRFAFNASAPFLPGFEEAPEFQF